MENIERPVEVSRAESAVRTDINDQEYIKDQLTTIYDYLDKFASAFNKVSVLDQVYPVGSIYISVNNTNPSTFIGGEWQKLSANYYLMASDNGGGGAVSGTSNTKNFQHSHKQNSCFSSGWGARYPNGYKYTSGESVADSDPNTDNALGNVDIRPASLAVCMWKRTK